MTHDGSRGRLRYLDLGTGPALVFLHGAGVRASSYSGLLKRLSATRRVIAPDLPGFGGSFTPPADWTAREYAGEVAGLLSALKLETFEVAGHSFGGAVALDLAAGNTAVTRLVLIDACAMPPPWSRLGLFARFLILKSLADLWNPRRWWRCLRVGLQVTGNLLRRGLRGVRILRIILREVARTDRPFEQVTQPVTIAWGMNDEVFPIASAHELTRRLPNARVERVPGNHDWCLFEDDLAASAILRERP